MSQDRPASGQLERPVMALVEVIKRYGDFVAIDRLTVAIESRELVAIVGPSGSGKSTLLSIMGTLERPTSGSVIVDGIDAVEASEDELAALRAQRIGFIFQRFFLLEAESAWENVATGLLYNGIPAAERRERAAEALRRVGLAHRIGSPPAKLSGGERQRVAVARALVSEPAIVLADEPTGNLDSHTSAELIELFVELNDEGSTIAIVSHDLEIAAKMPRQISLRDGRIEKERGR
jgi:putative ABC transport system ATP-binding protein